MTGEEEREGGGGEGDAKYRLLRYLFVGWVILETMLFGGLINGWASLVFVLKEDGLYGDLCTPALSDYGNATTVQPEDDSSTGCPGQDSMLNLWFTIAAAFRNVFGIVVGLFVYKFGTRSARIAGWVSFTAGSLMMAFADESIPWLVLPSLMTLSYGGVTLLLTNVQVSWLFPRAAGVVITLVSGAFDFSATTQLIVKVLHESGVSSRKFFYLGLCGLHAVMVLFSSLCFTRAFNPEFPEDPPATSSPPARTRRDSLYDWSEVKVHASRQGNKCRCTVLEDSNSSICSSSGGNGNTDTMQKDQLAVNGGLRRDADDVKTDDGGTKIPGQSGPETTSANKPSVSGTDETLTRDLNGPVMQTPTETDGRDPQHSNDRAELTSASTQADQPFKQQKAKKGAESPRNSTEIPHSVNMDARNNPRHGLTPCRCQVLAAQRNTSDRKPSSHTYLNGVDNKAFSSSSTISGSVDDTSRAKDTNNNAGKFISIIRISPFSITPLKTNWKPNLTSNDPLKSRDGDLTTTKFTWKEPFARNTLEAQKTHNGDALRQEGEDYAVRPEVIRWNGDGKTNGDCRENRKLKGRRSVTVNVKDVDEEEKKAESKDDGQVELYPDLKSCVKSVVFWLHVLWQACNVLRLVCFFGSVNTKLTTMFNGDKDKVSFFTNVQAYFMLTIMSVCWVSGAIYDWQTRLLKGRSHLFERTVLPGAVPLAMTSLVGVALSVVWLIDSEVMLYVLFALLVFYNAFIFGVCISFILRVFPGRYFGILNGLLSIIVGSFCFTQYGVFLWHESYEGGGMHADVFLLVLVAISLTHPAYIVIRSRCRNVTAVR